MADNSFGNGNKNPQFHLKIGEVGKEEFFWSPERGSGNRSNIAQGHHINPNNVVDRVYNSDLPDDHPHNIVARLFDALKTYAGYRQNDTERNQAWLPTGEDDSARSGAARHDTNHRDYDNFMERKYQEIGRHIEEL